MAWTAPRTWTTSETVTAAIQNEQVRNNLTYLYGQFNTTTGHDHDGVDSKALTWTALGTATFTTWIPGAAAVQFGYEGTLTQPHVDGYTYGPADADYEIIVPCTIPVVWGGVAVHITEIVLYGYTSANGVYFDAVYLRRSDLDGTYTDDVSYTTDIGNGSSGNVNATVYSGDLTLANFPYTFVVKTVGVAAATNTRVYGFKVSWQVN